MQCKPLWRKTFIHTENIHIILSFTFSYIHIHLQMSSNYTVKRNVCSLELKYMMLCIHTVMTSGCVFSDSLVVYCMWLRTAEDRKEDDWPQTPEIQSWENVWTKTLMSTMRINKVKHVRHRNAEYEPNIHVLNTHWHILTNKWLSQHKHNTCAHTHTQTNGHTHTNRVVWV